MPDFTPTAEQDAIVSFATSSTDNLCVIARAGAAKTSTLILVAEALPKKEILCLAFNKKIAEEMNERLPKNCTAKTLHGLGYAAWRGFISGKMKVDGRKVFFLLKAEIEKLEKEDKQDAYASMSETLQFIASAKQVGYLPESYSGHWRPLVGDEDFLLSLPLEPSKLQEILIEKVLIESFKLALGGVLDFDDMIYCPAICSVSWPTFPLTLIDEAQDLSPINHHILKKLVRKNRIIAVGDPCQAIYGFRGALADSMDQLQEKFSMTSLHLTISFRCSRAVTENAQWLAPDMRSPEWAVDGLVLRPLSWSASDISLGDAIICRNNAPLFSMAIRMIEAGLLPEIAGRDIGAPLIKIMKALGKPNLLKLAALDAITHWEETQTKRARPGAIGSIKDKASCIRIMLEATKTLGDAIAYLEHLLARDGRIHLMTGHKSKGLEFDKVFFLDNKLCQIERDQDANVKYVIETRAKNTLIYVTSDTFDYTTNALEAS